MRTLVVVFLVLQASAKPLPPTLFLIQAAI
jgi:hypothetical protein